MQTRELATARENCADSRVRRNDAFGRSSETEDALVLEVDRGVRLEKAFARGSGHGLLVLGADEVGTTLPPTLSFWQKFGARYVTALCSLPGIGERSKPPVPSA